MSASTEEFYAKHGKHWRGIVTSPAYKDAIDTAERTSESLKVVDYSPAEVKGVGDILFAKQQGAIEMLQFLTNLAEGVPPEFPEEPPESERYPDPLEELEETNRTKRKRA